MIYEAKCSRFLLSSAFSLGSLHQNGTRIMLKLIVNTYPSGPIKWYGIFRIWLRFKFNWKLRLQRNTYSFIPIVSKCEYLFCEHSTKIYLYIFYSTLTWISNNSLGFHHIFANLTRQSSFPFFFQKHFDLNVSTLYISHFIVCHSCPFLVGAFIDSLFIFQIESLWSEADKSS